MTRFGQAAIAYAERCGWSTFPLASGTKTPRVGSHGCHDATRHLGQIDEWWTEDPGANLGIATGAISGLVVLDVDPRHGGDESLATIEAEHGPLPDTPEVLTPSGGRHLYFTHPGRHVPNAAGLWSGLDVRGDGGYVVAPPSVLATGGTYEWEVAHHFDDMALAAAPEWLLARLPRDEGARAARAPEEWLAVWWDGIPEGKRNDTIAQGTGILLRRHVPASLALLCMLGLNARFGKPQPLPESEVIRTVDSIAAAERRRRKGDDEHRQHRSARCRG